MNPTENEAEVKQLLMAVSVRYRPMVQVGQMTDIIGINLLKELLISRLKEGYFIADGAWFGDLTLGVVVLYVKGAKLLIAGDIITGAINALCMGPTCQVAWLDVKDAAWKMIQNDVRGGEFAPWFSIADALSVRADARKQ